MDKIKAFITKIMQNKKLFWSICGGAVALIVAAIVLIVVLTGGNTGLAGCTVEVKTEGGMAMNGIGVYIYTDTSKNELIYFAKTDENGMVSVTEEIPQGSVVMLADVPAGYDVAQSYSITEAATKITLSAVLLEEMTELTPGCVMFDFTVTDTDGNSHTLSQLLKEKKAVVLNLWYTNCQPCKAEFPYLQQAYEKYSDSIALLAIDPDSADDADAISAFKAANNLTFPMIKADGQWSNVIPNIAFPTTIIIDRFGTVGLIHTGSVDNAETFAGAFEYFTAENYVQSIVEDIKTLKAEGSVASEGTLENPKEFAGVTEFEVTVPAGQTIYCNVYRVSGLEMTVKSNDVKIGFNEETYEPTDGTVTLTVPSSTDPNTPALISFENTGTEIQTYKVTFAAPEGSMEKPFELKLGDLTAEIAAGNSQGVYYTYTAENEGKFTVSLNKSDVNETFTLALNNLTSSVYLTLDENGIDEDGKISLTVDVKKLDKIQLVVSSVPNDKGEYAAASVKLNTTAAAQEEEEETTPPATSSSGNSGSSSGNSGSSSGNSGSSSGNSGSSSGNSGSSSGNSGSSSGNNNEAEDTNKPLNTKGKLTNPDDAITQAMETFETKSIGGGEIVLYAIRGIGTATIQIKDDSAYIIYDGKTYIPEDGVVSITITRDDAFAPTMLQIGNGRTSAKTFKVSFYYPSGSQGNPIKYELNKTVTTTSKRGNDQGIYYTYTASKAGTLTIKIKSCSASTGCGITITTKTGNTIQETVQSTEGDTVSIKLEANQRVEIIISALPDQRNNYPKATIETSGTLA